MATVRSKERDKESVHYTLYTCAVQCAVYIVQWAVQCVSYTVRVRCAMQRAVTSAYDALLSMNCTSKIHIKYELC